MVIISKFVTCYQCFYPMCKLVNSIEVEIVPALIYIYLIIFKSWSSFVGGPMLPLNVGDPDPQVPHG